MLLFFSCFSKDFEFESIDSNSVIVNNRPRNIIKFSKNLLIPGLGFEKTNKKIIYSSIEFVNVVSLVYFVLKGHRLEKRVASFSALHAGIYTTNIDVWNQMKTFNSLNSYSGYYGYNNYSRLFGNEDKLFDESKYYWNWDSEGSRKEFKNLLNYYNKNKTYISFSIGAMILNRLISSIDYYFVSRNIGVSLQTSPGTLSFTKTF